MTRTIACLLLCATLAACQTNSRELPRDRFPGSDPSAASFGGGKR